MVVRHALEGGHREIEVTPEAQDVWVALLLTGMGNLIGSPDCTPGYYTNEGQPLGPGARLNVGYPAGSSAYFKYLDGWRNSGAFEGLAFTGTRQRISEFVKPLARSSIKGSSHKAPRAVSKNVLREHSTRKVNYSCAK
jgi:hypothetical protein